jgi:group I intron endonuclease
VILLKTKQQLAIGAVGPGDMAYLYKITNLINNKCYVGWTGKTVEDRWQRHQKDALTHRDNRKFYNAIRKYGASSWTVETLMEVTSINEAKQKEIELIEKYNSYSQGYNATKGGDGNNGIIMSEESNLARSRALKGRSKNYDRMKGKKHSEETKTKISMAHQGMKKPWVKPTKEQIIKSAMTRRGLTKEQFDQMHLLRSQGLTIRVIAEKIGSNPDMVKKWLKKEWTL